MDGPFFTEEAPARYPDVAGAKKRNTSFAAAAGVEPKAKSLRIRVLEAVTLRAGTPEDIAKRLGEPVMNIRPRLSEAAKLGLVVDSGHRGKAMGGRQAIVWEVAT